MTRDRSTKTATWALAFLLAFGVAGVASAAEPAGVPPVRSFFRNPDMNAAELSPDGRWLAVATGANGVRVGVVVVDLEHKLPPAVVAQFGDADVRSFDWVNDNWLVFSVVDLQSGAGDQRFSSGLFSVRRDGRDLRRLVRPRRDFLSNERSIGAAPLEYNHMLLSVPETGGDEVIVGEFAWDARGDIERIHPLRLNVATGRSVALASGAPERVQRWLFDPKGEPRVAVQVSRGEEEIFWRGPGEAGWRSLLRQSRNSGTFRPVSVDAAGQLFVTTGGPRGESVLRRFDFQAGKTEADSLVSAPGFDFRGEVVTDRATPRALGVRVHTDAESTVWFDAHMKKVQALADARFPGRANRLSCHTCSPESNVLVYSYSDQDPGSYWIYRPAGNAWESVGKLRRDVDPRRMGQLDLHRIKSRDGHDLPVWVTMPPGNVTAPRPAVVLVHGGPWLRGGFWNWDADAQFLASRGYVVIEPEFRGSLGYGFAHFQRGWKQWGTAMQDDVADAMQWAVDKGLVDGKRVCIAGASYGGYSTLMSLVRHPDRYRCGVAWVAVSDPRLLMTDVWRGDIPLEARRHTLPEIIGDPEKDADMLKAATPWERAKEIRAPLLMAWGREDRRVPLDHGHRMRDAMRAAGQSPEWIVYDDEAHGWLKVDNRVDFWQRVERFLDKHLR